jgi:hypothetical protein
MSESDSDHELSSQAIDVDEWEEDGEEDTDTVDEEEEGGGGREDEEDDEDTTIQRRLVIGLDYGTTYTGITYLL